MIAFSERLKDLRTEKNLTMKQVADGIQVSEVSISRWESNARIPNIYNAIALAKFFKVSVDYLLGVED